jgi:hypothetical protein
MYPVPRPNSDQLRKLLSRVKALACEYYKLTGKPLGVTGEVAELEAAEKLGLTLAVARTPFYDATRGAERFQIKGRAVSRADRYRGRAPSIKCDGEFDAVLLILLDRPRDFGADRDFKGAARSGSAPAGGARLPRA